MNPDGVSYLDLADSWRRGDVAGGINAFWSPMYPMLLGGVFALLRPAPEWLFPCVHLVNFGIFVLALIAFGFFLREACDLGQKGGEGLRWPWIIFGAGTFVVASFDQIGIWRVSPDLLVAAFLFASAGLGLRVLRGVASRPLLMVTGAVLGAGYVAKAVLLPIGLMLIVFLLIGLWKNAHGSRVARFTALLLPYTLCVAPLVIVLSIREGRFTTGAAGRLNYAWCVNGASYGWLEAGENGVPASPPGLIHRNPPVYDFGELPGTVVKGLGRPHFFEGLRIRFRWRRQAKRFLADTTFLAELLLTEPVSIAGLLTLLLLAMGRRPIGLPSERLWILAWCCGGIFLYVLVLILPRYLAGLVAIAWVISYSCLLPGETAASMRGAGGAILFVVGLTCCVPAALSLPGTLRHGVADLARGTFHKGDPLWATASSAMQMGFHRGDRMASVGDSFPATFAPLIGARIVSEIPDEAVAQFWGVSPSERREIFAAWKRVGVRWAWASEIPNWAASEGWVTVPGSKVGFAIVGLTR